MVGEKDGPSVPRSLLSFIIRPYTAVQHAECPNFELQVLSNICTFFSMFTAATAPASEAVASERVRLLSRMRKEH